MDGFSFFYISAAEQLCNGLLVQLGADDHQFAAHVGAAGTHFPLAGHIVELQPAVGTAVHDALAAQDHAVIAGVQLGEGVLHFGLGELAGRLDAPAGEHLIGVVVMMMVVMAAAAVVAVLMMMLVLVLIIVVIVMVVAAAAMLLVVMILIVIMVVLMLVVVIVLVMVVMVMLVLVLVVILMVAAPFVNPSVVNLPSVSKASAAPADPVEVVVYADGHLAVKAKNGLHTVDMPALIANVRAAQGEAATPVVISADRDVRYETVVNVMKSLQDAKVERVGLALKIERSK